MSADERRVDRIVAAVGTAGAVLTAATVRIVDATRNTATVRTPGGDRLAPLVVGVGIVLGWHGYVTSADVPSIVLPGPIEVALALRETWPTLLADAAVTAATAGLGLLLGGFVGLTLAFGMLRWRTVRAVSLPYVVGLRIAPVIAIAPLVFLWLGRGIVPRAVVVATLTQFPVAVGTLSGLRSVPREYLDVCRSVDATDRQLFVHVRLPAAASSVVASAQIAATLAVIGAVVAEFVTLRSGLGYRVYETGLRLRTAEMYAALAVLALVGIAFYHLPGAAVRLRRYRPLRQLRSTLPGTTSSDRS